MPWPWEDRTKRFKAIRDKDKQRPSADIDRQLDKEDLSDQIAVAADLDDIKDCLQAVMGLIR